MQTVVDAIPLLLQVSLLLFLAGLAVFLMPVHNLMAFVAAGIFLGFTAVYGIFTILPLWSSDCPYHTPLSGVSWRILQSFKKVLLQARNSTDEYPHSFDLENLEDFPDYKLSLSGSDWTMVKAMTRTALEASPERDQKALVWTLKSLPGNGELQIFADALPDLLWGPHKRRYGYEDHIRHLVYNPQTQLHWRVAGLLESCNTDSLAANEIVRRRMTCYKALWTIASLAEPMSVNLQHSIPCILYHFVVNINFPGTSGIVPSPRSFSATIT
jgi:hypothetical protein